MFPLYKTQQGLKSLEKKNSIISTYKKNLECNITI